MAQWLADAGEDGDAPALPPMALPSVIAAPKEAEAKLPSLEEVLARIPAETIQLVEELFQVRFKGDVKRYRADRLA